MQEIVPLSTSPVKPFSLSSPVRLLARPCLSVDTEDSLALASSRILQNGSNLLPVLSHARVTGVLTGNGLAMALGDAAEFSDAIKGYMEPAQTIPAYATGAEALRAFVDGNPLIVVDDDKRLVGIVAPADLYPKRMPRMRPPSIGGMATPLGVYLTAGSVNSGVSKFALALSGASLSAMIYGSLTASVFISIWLMKNGLTPPIAHGIEAVCTLLLFCGLFRFLPLSGIHGAEHQVVHAIERELELTPEVVKRMPRYHPRCGTNYSVGFAIFLTAFSALPVDDAFRLMFACVVTLALWRPIGRFAQNHVTTKRPSAKQLDQAIRAGEELLNNYANARTNLGKPLMWIWRSGLPMVLLGMLTISSLVSVIAYVLKINYL